MYEKEVLKVLQRVRSELSNPDQWCKEDGRRFKRDVNHRSPRGSALFICTQECVVRACDSAVTGRPLMPWRFDFIPALSTTECAISSFSTYVIREVLAEQLNKHPDEVEIVRWNDDPNTTHEDLMKVLDAAIEKAKAKIPN